MSWSSLPEELWKLILVHVSLTDRLCSCSRVSKKLCRAAAAATAQLKLNLQEKAQQRFDGLAQWLQNNGSHVTSLELAGACGGTVVLTELPCQQLRQLGVSGLMVQLGPSSSHPGVLHSCSSLTKLELYQCRVDDDSLSVLSATPALQHLSTPASTSDDQLDLPCNILQVLTQLTFLSLSDSVEVTAESLQHISALQHLQVLGLDNPSVPLSPSSIPGLAQLTALHTIKLSEVTSMDAAVLQHITGLRQLTLYDVVLTGASSGAELLSVIGQQQQLEQLVMCDVQCQWPTSAAAYTALAASGRLQGLRVQLDGMPAGVYQAMLRPQQLPHLQRLQLGSFVDDENEGFVQDHLATALSSTDISRLVAYLPWRALTRPLSHLSSPCQACRGCWI